MAQHISEDKRPSLCWLKYNLSVHNNFILFILSSDFSADLTAKNHDLYKFDQSHAVVSAPETARPVKY